MNKQYILNPFYKLLTLLLCHLIYLPSSLGQVILYEFPSYYQLYPRDLNTNMATIPIEGFVFANSDYETLRIKIYRNDVLESTMEYELDYADKNSIVFKYEVEIPAELANYTIQLHGYKDNMEFWEMSAEHITAGDVYIINGQSNAQALSAPHPDDIHEFTRSYNAEHKWGKLHLSYPGLWGARLARQIVENHQIPVAIFNEAVGGKPIEFFLRDAIDIYANNYGMMYQRLEEANLKNHIRAAFWFHGEANGWGMSIEAYEAAFMDLKTAWEEDYQIKNTYMYQVRAGSCFHPFPYVLEAQRQMALEHEDIYIMSSGNVAHDSCHFAYENGYRELGDRMFQMMAIEEYDASYNPHFFSPDIQKAYRSAENEITLEFNHTDTLDLIGWPWMDFYLENSDFAITNGRVEANTVILELNGDVDTTVAVTYMTHPGPANHYVVNETGVSILSFYNVPLCGACAPDNDTLNTVVVFPKEIPAIRISPNPASNILSLQYETKNSLVTELYIHDLQGLVYQYQKNTLIDRNAIDLDISNLNAGVYIIKMIVDNQIITRRFVKI